jgi:hypothetical protein
MSGFFGLDPSGLISSIGSALGALAPAPAQGQGFTPAPDQGGQFSPAPAVGGANVWPTVTMGGGGLEPAQLNLGSFQPSGGDYGGFQPSDMGYGGFAPSPGAGGSPFQPTPFNPLTYDPRQKPAAAGPNGTSGTATYTGLKPEVAQWAPQVQAAFGKYGSYVSDAMLAIIQHESGGNPNVQNQAGYPAYGLFQLWERPGLDANQQFAAAEELLQQKLAMTQAAYDRLGLNPDDATRARDLFLAWAGQFDPATAGPNGNRDVGSGEDGNAYLYGPNGIMPMYESIVRGKQASGGTGASGLVQRAQTLLGTPYSLGGLRSHPNNPQAGLDCSEYTAWIYQGQGVNLPWNAQQQYNATGRVQNPNELQVGDLVFFQGTNAADPDVVTHVGMYIGNGQFINSQDGGVKVANLSDPYWQQHYYGGGRVATF